MDAQTIDVFICFYWFLLVSVMFLFICSVAQSVKNRRLKWDCGIYDILQQEYKFGKPDPNKDFLYLPRRFVGVWQDENHIICDMMYHVENVELIDMLAQNYNLILYIPFIDHDGVRVKNINPSMEYITRYNFPIKYITQELPSPEILTPMEFYFNHKKYILNTYIRKKG